MAFSIAQYESAVDKVETGSNDISQKLNQVGPTANRSAAFLPGPLADGVIWLGNKILEIGKWILEKIIDLLKGAAAPIYMFKYSLDWQDVKGSASEISSALQSSELTATQDWRGDAADRYGNAVPAQPKAADSVKSTADKVTVVLATSAGAALAFYVALGVIIVKFVIALVAALTALGSVVFSWAGAALIVEEAAVNSGLIIAAVSALVAALGAQAGQLSTLHGEVQDGSAFPGGKWPDAVGGMPESAREPSADTLELNSASGVSGGPPPVTEADPGLRDERGPDTERFGAFG